MKVVTVFRPVMIRDLAAALEVSAQRVMDVLNRKGVAGMVTLNSTLDDEVVRQVGLRLGCYVEVVD